MEPRAAGMGMDSEREPGRAGAARGRDEVTPSQVHVHLTATLWVVFWGPNLSFLGKKLPNSAPSAAPSLNLGALLRVFFSPAKPSAG